MRIDNLLIKPRLYKRFGEQLGPHIAGLQTERVTREGESLFVRDKDGPLQKRQDFIKISGFLDDRAEHLFEQCIQSYDHDVYIALYDYLLITCSMMLGDELDNFVSVKQARERGDVNLSTAERVRSRITYIRKKREKDRTYRFLVAESTEKLTQMVYETAKTRYKGSVDGYRAALAQIVWEDDVTTQANSAAAYLYQDFYRETPNLKALLYQRILTYRARVDSKRGENTYVIIDGKRYAYVGNDTLEENQGYILRGFLDLFTFKGQAIGTYS